MAARRAAARRRNSPAHACVPGALAAGDDRALEAEQETVEVDRDDLGGVDRRHGARVREPAGAEVPAALGGGADVAEHLAARAPARARELGVLAVGLIAGRVAIVPVAIEDRAVGHRDHTAVRRARLERRGAFHPERVLAAQLRQVARQRLGRIGGQQPHHGEEKRRLRAAEIVSPGAVRHMAVRVDQVARNPRTMSSRPGRRGRSRGARAS